MQTQMQEAKCQKPAGRFKIDLLPGKATEVCDVPISNTVVQYLNIASPESEHVTKAQSCFRRTVAY